MKIKHVNKLVRLTIATAILSGSAGMVVASEATPTQHLVAKVIELHAPNNATQTVTVWLPAPVSRNAGETKTVRNDTAKVIELPASNCSIQSVTVWSGGTKNKTDIAPLK